MWADGQDWTAATFCNRLRDRSENKLVHATPAVCADNDQIHSVSTCKGIHLLIQISLENNRPNLNPTQPSRLNQLMHEAIDIPFRGFGGCFHCLRAYEGKCER